MERLTAGWQHSPGLRLVHLDRAAAAALVQRLTPLALRWLRSGRFSLPAGWQAAVQRNGSLPLVKTDGLAEQQPGDHPAQQHQVTFVADGAVLTQEAGEFSMEPGVGIHEGLAWCDNPNLSWLPAHPMA